MIKVFIGGSRKVSRLSAEVRQRLDRIIKKGFPVLIGDANGVDKVVQQYFHEHNYNQVEVFCMEGVCRNNLGGWPTRSISAVNRKRDFSYYSSKDRVMADDASVGFMIWDGKSKGTLTNVFRLISQNKKVVIYTAPSKQFSDLKNKADWDVFLSSSGNDLGKQVERRAFIEGRKSQSPVQLNLFSANRLPEHQPA
ncbi:MAG: hypothetical protein NT166_23995 [Candidatus Aminicenantes bacterium]|nr:hypothetical protein [Candidatus Aminicenantes bacterium]